MKIIRIRLNGLRNEEWFEFSGKFCETVKHFGKETIGIKGLYDRFVPLYQKTDHLLVVLRRSVYTTEMETVDKKRDDLFRGHFSVVKGMRRQPLVSKRQAAERLYNLLEGHRETILYGSYEAKSAAIYNLLQDLKGAYAADVTLLALTDWVTSIEETEGVFLSLSSERTQESIDKPKENLRQFRSQADVLYTAMANVLDAQLLADGLGGDVVVEPGDLDDEMHIEGDEGSHELHGNVTYNFVIAWNETVKKYRNILAQRAGRRAKSNGAGAAES
ncbi:MAG: DUF6261 family protein [Tannerellaceae bacterium]|jgi:hypothetical protein|nr:DUF6261 family protein [Tannerellaceae bacterium]